MSAAAFAVRGILRRFHGKKRTLFVLLAMLLLVPGAAITNSSGNEDEHGQTCIKAAEGCQRADQALRPGI